MKAKRVLALVLCAAMVLPSESLSVYAMNGGVDMVSENPEEETQDIQEEETADADTEESVSESTEDETAPSEEETTGEEKTADEADEKLMDIEGSGEAVPAEFYSESSPFLTVDEDGTLHLAEGQKLSGTTVTIPKEAKKIPKGIFNDVVSVKNVKFTADSELTEIEAGAFEGSGITEIQLPAGVTEIQEGVFKNSELKRITFLGQVTFIGSTAFSDTKLERIDAPYVTEVGSSAFENCSELTEVKMPVLKSIDARAFRFCTKLNSGMVWNAGLESIGNEAFKGTGFIDLDLTVLTNPDLTIGAKAFEGCTSLRKVSLPKQLSALNTGTFKNCTSLENVKFDEYAETQRLGEEVFSGCKMLGSIALPASVRTIDVNAFYGCEGLDTIIINHPSPNGDDFSIAQNAFPSRSRNSAVTMEGYGGKVREYAESKGYTYVSLFARYNINSYKNEHAVIALNKSAASAGEEVQVTVTTDEGYTLKDEGIQVTSKLGTQDVSLVSVSGNKYVFRFTMPNGQVSISAFAASIAAVTDGELSLDFGAVNGYRGSFDADKKVLTLDKTGRETNLIVRLKDNVQAGAWLMNYQTSNKEVATISSQGRICARGLGTATITASLKNDANKKVTFKVKVEQDVLVDKLELDLGTPSRARITQEVIDGKTYPVVEYKKATVAGNAYSFKVSVKATEAGSDSNVIVNSTWASVDQNIATVARTKSTDNSNTITVKKGVEGETMISVTVRNKDTAKTERTESFIVRVVDGTPRLADSKVTVNIQSELGAAVDIVPVYGYQIFEDTGLQLCRKVISGGLVSYEPVSGFQVTGEEGSYHIRTTADFKLNAGASVTYKGDSGLYLQGEYSKDSETGDKVGTGELFVIPVPELTVVNKALAPTLKISGKINLFYTSEADANDQGSVIITQNLKNETVTGYRLVSNENDKAEGTEETDSFAANFEVEKQENGSARITRSSGELVKKNNKAVTSGYLYIYYDGYRNPVKKKITVPTCTVKPVYQLSVSTVTASTYRKNQEYVICLKDKKTKKQIELDENDSLSFDYGAGTTEGLFDETALSEDLANGNITIQVKGTPRDGKAVILVKKDAWSTELRYTFSLKTTKTHPTVKFQTSVLVLNQLCPEQEAAAGVLVSGNDAEFAGFDRSTLVYTGSKKYLEDAEKLLANMKLDQAGIHVSLPDGVRPGTYSFRVMPQIRYKGTDYLYYRNALSFQVAVKTNNPEIKLKKSTYTLNTRYAGQETVESTYSILNIPAGADYELKTDHMNLTPVNSKSLGAMNMKGYIHAALENGVISVRLDENAPVSGFTYEYYVDGLSVQAGEKTVPVKRFKVAVKGITTAATVSVTGKGTINSVNPESSIVYTAKVNSVNSEIGEVKIWELQKNGSYYYDGSGLQEDNRMSEHFTVSVENGKAVVRAKDTSVLKASTSYRIRLAYVLKAAPDQYVISKTFTITPTQTLPKIQTDKTSAYLYAGQNRDKTVRVQITQLSVPEAKIESVDFAKGTPSAVKKAYRVSYDEETGVMTLILVNPAELVLNKKYTITFETRCEKQMENSTGRTFKLDVTVRK